MGSERVYSASKNIRSISQDGIIYVDENGDEQWLDFASCLETYISWVSKSQFTTARQIEDIRRSKDVGDISYLGTANDDDTYTPPYVIFHDKHGTIFEFESQEECAAFHQNIGNLGWHLFDLDD